MLGVGQHGVGTVSIVVIGTSVMLGTAQNSRFTDCTCMGVFVLVLCFAVVDGSHSFLGSECSASCTL